MSGDETEPGWLDIGRGSPLLPPVPPPGERRQGTLGVAMEPERVEGAGWLLAPLGSRPTTTTPAADPLPPEATAPSDPDCGTSADGGAGVSSKRLPAPLVTAGQFHGDGDRASPNPVAKPQSVGASSGWPSPSLVASAASASPVAADNDEADARAAGSTAMNDADSLAWGTALAGGGGGTGTGTGAATPAWRSLGPHSSTDNAWVFPARGSRSLRHRFPSTSSHCSRSTASARRRGYAPSVSSEEFLTTQIVDVSLPPTLMFLQRHGSQEGNPQLPSDSKDSGAFGSVSSEQSLRSWLTTSNLLRALALIAAFIVLRLAWGMLTGEDYPSAPSEETYALKLHGFELLDLWFPDGDEHRKAGLNDHPVSDENSPGALGRQSLKSAIRVYKLVHDLTERSEGHVSDLVRVISELPTSLEVSLSAHAALSLATSVQAVMEMDLEDDLAQSDTSIAETSRRLLTYDQRRVAESLTELSAALNEAADAIISLNLEGQLCLRNFVRQMARLVKAYEATLIEWGRIEAESRDTERPASRGCGLLSWGCWLRSWRKIGITSRGDGSRNTQHTTQKQQSTHQDLDRSTALNRPVFYAPVVTLTMDTAASPPAGELAIRLHRVVEDSLADMDALLSGLEARVFGVRQRTLAAQALWHESGGVVEREKRRAAARADEARRRATQPDPAPSLAASPCGHAAATDRGAERQQQQQQQHCGVTGDPGIDAPHSFWEWLVWDREEAAVRRREREELAGRRAVEAEAARRLLHRLDRDETMLVGALDTVRDMGPGIIRLGHDIKALRADVQLFRADLKSGAEHGSGRAGAATGPAVVPSVGVMLEVLREKVRRMEALAAGSGAARLKTRPTV
ncbi:hypothetical protein HK405_008952 [Cladochytrium tenue]|nr:hypothetical protein HK405_008952 [Cladochytrium tenue]